MLAGMAGFVIPASHKTLFSKKKHNIMNRHIIILCCMAFLSVGLSSCSDDDNTQKLFDNMSGIFQKLKGNYTGRLEKPDHSFTTMGFSIVDETVGGSLQTNVKVPSFPLEFILAKVHPADYQYAKVTSCDVYMAPVDSVGYQMNFMNFKTDDDHTAQLNFTYVHNNETHTGWTQVSTKGNFFYNIGVLNATFEVVDLVVDKKDKTELLPISFTLDADMIH